MRDGRDLPIAAGLKTELRGSAFARAAPKKAELRASALREQLPKSWAASVGIARAAPRKPLETVSVDALR
jgi:hypothetical protein